MSDFIQKLVNGDLESFRQEVFDTLYAKSGEALEARKIDIANSLYSESPEQQEEPELESEETEE
jgi:hypothetical protein